MMKRQGRSRRAPRRTWGAESLEGRRLMTAGLAAQFAPGWGDAVDVRFDRYTTSFQESAGRVPITITRGGDLTLGATARVRTSTVDAVAGYDYYGLDQAVNFAPGSATATFYLTILDDKISEPFTKALYLQVYQTSDVISTETVASMMVLIEDDEAGSRTPLTFHAFGDAGLWTYNEAEGYRKINDASPEAVYPAPNRGAYLDFGASGLWYWDALTGYEKLNDADAEGVLTSPLGDSLLVDFGAQGLWTWSRADGFAQVTDVDPEAMAGTAERGLVDFGRAGLWAFDFNASGLSPFGATTWTKLDDQSPKAIVATGGTFYVDYGARGLWQVGTTITNAASPSGGSQVRYRTVLNRINPADPGTIASTSDGLFVDFGSAGLWNFHGGAWTKVNDLAPAATWAGQGGLYLNYGAAGLWRLAGGTWTKLNEAGPARASSVTRVARAEPAQDEFDLDYGDAGLWRWSTSKGWKKLNVARATALGAARLDTGVSYGVIPA